MTPQQQLFVDEFLKDLTAGRAAVRAGYAKKSADQQGYKLLQMPEIAAAIREALAKRSERTQIDSDWVLKRLAGEAMADLAEIYADDGSLKPIAEWPLIWRQGLVSGLDVDETLVEGERLGQVTKVKLSDRIKRIELIGKHVDVQAFAERKEIGGIGGGAVKIEDVSVLDKAMLIGLALRKAAEIKNSKD